MAMRDFTGMKIGKLTAISYRIVNGKILWAMRCDCESVGCMIDKTPKQLAEYIRHPSKHKIECEECKLAARKYPDKNKGVYIKNHKCVLPVKTLREVLPIIKDIDLNRNLVLKSAYVDKEDNKIVITFHEISTVPIKD